MQRIFAPTFLATFFDWWSRLPNQCGQIRRLHCSERPIKMWKCVLTVCWNVCPKLLWNGAIQNVANSYLDSYEVGVVFVFEQSIGCPKLPINSYWTVILNCLELPMNSYWKVMAKVSQTPIELAHIHHACVFQTVTVTVFGFSNLKWDSKVKCVHTSTPTWLLAVRVESNISRLLKNCYSTAMVLLRWTPC